MKKHKDNTKFIEDIGNASCTTDCTGLIQIPPENESELEAYKEIYSFTATPKANKKSKRG